LLEAGKRDCGFWPLELNIFFLVALNSDSSVRRLKGRNRPYLSFTDRARMLAAIRYVDAVVGFAEDTPEALIRFLAPTVLVKGEEYKDQDVPGARYCRFVVWVPMAGQLHTTELLRRIREANC
jgi:D-beta-D-heptose 7-phosphate kinase/D-beta-D-heptose 1-phosphate adenosyltransferase